MVANSLYGREMFPYIPVNPTISQTYPIGCVHCPSGSI